MSTVDPTLENMEADLAKPGEPSPVDSFEAMLNEFAELENERRQLEERLEVIKTRTNTLQEPLLNHFADTGMQNARIKGLTVYVKTDRYVSKRGDASTEQVCQVLRDHGLGYIVSEGYNASSLKSKIVKEYIEADVEVPDALAAVLNIGETTKLATRK